MNMVLYVSMVMFAHYVALMHVVALATSFTVTANRCWFMVSPLLGTMKIKLFFVALLELTYHNERVYPEPPGYHELSEEVDLDVT